MAKTFYFNTINMILTSYIENLLSCNWLYYKSKKYFYKSNIILLLDNGKWVQDILKHGSTKFYNCRMIWQGGGPPAPPLWIRAWHCVRDVEILTCSSRGLRRTVLESLRPTSLVPLLPWHDRPRRTLAHHINNHSLRISRATSLCCVSLWYLAL